MIDREIAGPIAWTRKTLASGEGSARLGPECLVELMAVAALLRANPLPVPVLCQGRPAADPGGRPSGEAAMSDNGFCVIYAPGGCRADTARGRPAPARSAALRRAHALDPVDPEIVYALAAFYLRQGRDERAMMYARRLAELVPEDPRAGVIVDRVGQKRSSGRSAS